ncbi:MAG TPA: tetratricopeptide repeat protein [Candidatus Sulfotelmatobacter sp.]
MPESKGDSINPGRKKLDFRRYLRREPVVLALLSVLAVVFFLAVTGLSHMFHAQQEFLGNRWFMRGNTDLQQGHFDRAVTEFRASLLYSRDNYSYQLNLAQALLGLKRTGEADSYLINLWEREPENGLVNLALARIAAQKGETEKALRYYHNAVYATWPGDQEVQRRDTRLELIEYLLNINAKAQAQAELIALAANLEDDPVQQAQVADFFLQAGDYEHALAEYRLTLKAQPHEPSALAGAGFAAYQLGHYSLAERYLQGAVAADPNDAQSAARLRTAALVMKMDPFQRQISVAQRDRIVLEAFTTASERLKSCSPAGDLNTTLPGLAGDWAKMKPRVTELGLRRDPDLVNSAMDLVFNIERQTEHQVSRCGAPTATDTALLLIAKLHETS